MTGLRTGCKADSRWSWPPGSNKIWHRYWGYYETPTGIYMRQNVYLDSMNKNMWQHHQVMSSGQRVTTNTDQSETDLRLPDQYGGQQQYRIPQIWTDIQEIVIVRRLSNMESIYGICPSTHMACGNMLMAKNLNLRNRNIAINTQHQRWQPYGYGNNEWTTKKP